MAEKGLATIMLQDLISEYPKDFDGAQQKVGKWKYPRWIEIVEDLPKTATGKIQRFKLREAKGDAS